MRRTFLNGTKDTANAGEEHLKSRSDDFKAFMKMRDLEKTAYDDDGNEIGNFYEYGLSFEFHEATDKMDGYYSYLLSYGGPSEEVRFHEDGNIEFVYLDWFVGVGFDVTNEPWAIWLKDWFTDCQSIDWESKSHEEKYQLMLEEEEEEEQEDDE